MFVGLLTGVFGGSRQTMGEIGLVWVFVLVQLDEAFAYCRRAMEEVDELM
jgi:hypothetical protein